MVSFDLMRGPNGEVRCCLCFELIKEGEHYVDSDGQKWDVHARCEALDRIASDRNR
jgi:hypothetical protein